MSCQTKYHKYICEGLRWLCFLSVIIMLVLWLVHVWTDYVEQITLSKMFATTLALFLASVVTSIIFYKAKDKTEA